MALIQWESLKDIEDLLDRYTRFFPWPSGRGPSRLGMGDWHPRVDISEKDDHDMIQSHIPGVAKEDLKITIENGVLTIEGERRQERKEENERVHRLERSYGSFSRSFALPDDADASALRANAAEGQLTVTVPRKAAAPAASAVQVPVE